MKDISSINTAAGFFPPSNRYPAWRGLTGRLLRTFAAVAVAGAGLLVASAGSNRPVGHFEPVATYQVSGAVAEIVSATPDGLVLVYTDSESQEIGFVDISDPANPTELATIAVGGEPTAVAITPDSAHALVTVNGDEDDGQSDHLAVFDLGALGNAPVLLSLGGQPDSVAVSPDGRYAAIAIENERDEDVEEGAMPQSPPGFLTIVDLVGSPGDWTTREVNLEGYGRFPTDPEPEFVDINAANQVAVTLQENNHIVIVDLASGIVTGDFTAGTVTHLADLEDDDQILFDDLLEDSRREPDAIGWTPRGNLVVANEGDYDLDVDFVGGRGFTIFSPSGQVLFDSGAELEWHLAAAGFYDDGRSDAKGSEPEGIEIGTYHNHTFLFVGMERADPGAVAVYRLTGNEANPVFVQVLETGARPEGLLAIPQRALFVSANEDDGTISIFQGQPGKR